MGMSFRGYITSSNANLNINFFCKGFCYRKNMKAFLISANTVRVPYYIYRSGLDYVTVAKLLKV